MVVRTSGKVLRDDWTSGVASSGVLEGRSSANSLGLKHQVLKHQVRRWGAVLRGSLLREEPLHPGAAPAGRDCMLRPIPRGRGAQPQHPYQRFALAATMHEGSQKQLLNALGAGLCRLELTVPARARFLRWRLRRALMQALAQQEKVTRRVLRHLPVLLALMGASLACSLVSKGGGDDPKGFSVSPLAPDLSKPKLASPPRRRKDAPWNYVLPVDHGVRADASGQGHFRAPRFHGEHNGLDLLAPLGTPVFAPCDGMATTGVSQSFGRWVHVICPVPDKYKNSDAPEPWVSFFYAHLDKADLTFDKWVEVSGAQPLGQVGKSGNARGPNIQPHLHLELIVQKNRRAAMDEHHLGRDQSSVDAAEFFADQLSRSCMAPFGFQAKSQMLRRARRIDPFIALTCLSEFKPNFIKAPSPLTDSSRAWTQYYVAKDFNVNLGVEDSSLAYR